MTNCNSTKAPTEFSLKLIKKRDGKKVNSILYKQIVGSLMYLTTMMPNIIYSVSLTSRYIKSPNKKHVFTVKRILCYLQETKDFEIFYKNDEKSDMIGFTDSDYIRDQDGSTSDYVVMLGTMAISWSSKKQSIVTLLSTKAEFVVVTTYACQAIWLTRILEQLQFKLERATTTFYDNNVAIKLSKNLVLHGRSMPNITFTRS
ncbi:secreted RxLR effector protein 161-like [Gossypium hirsutum]|uniref:Secreted RxLR effector protein 161-like n=1 Tax=Gossypium hirsutum TaxID=3635 RepID=A0ABM2ZT41_GOSHI|nr:secreted RxLR effector protein 161-like [Gossypium hirsutum]